MKIIYKILILIFQFSLILLILTSFFTLVTSKSELLGGIRSFVVVSGSMQPALPVGSIVFVQNGNNYKKGDIVAFTNKLNQTVTHRIVEVVKKEDGQYFRLKGDANNSADGDLVKSESIVGRQFLKIPYLGQAVRFLRTLPGFIGLIILPSVVFIGFELWNIKKEMEKQIEKKYLQKYHRLQFS